MVKAPLSLKKLVYLDGQKAVLYRSKMNPALGRNFEAMDPIEWLARLADHIPDTGRHRTHPYAWSRGVVRRSPLSPADGSGTRRSPPRGAGFVVLQRDGRAGVTGGD